VGKEASSLPPPESCRPIALASALLGSIIMNWFGVAGMLVESKHLFTELKVVRTGSTTKAFVTCTGGLYGIDTESEKPVTIDSWVGEVHFLVKDKSAWKFLGNVGRALPEVPATSAPIIRCSDSEAFLRPFPI
jgi:hypothetical protein